MSFSTKKYVWGVKITLNQTITEDTSIGLYDNAGLSEFRWITNSASTTLAYKDGVLAEGGIGTIGQESDFTTGGNIATVKGFTCTIAGSFAGTPIWETIRDAGINLVGKQIQVIEFDISTDPATETVLRTFVIDKINSWNEESYSFECVSAYHKRNTYLSEQDELGNAVPVLFGKDVLCKLASVSISNALDLSLCPGASGSGLSIKIYPIVVRDVSGSGYIVYLYTGINFINIAALQAYLNGQTLKIVSGGGNGVYRTIDGSLVTLRTISPFGSCIGLYVIDNEDEIKAYGSTLLTEPATSFAEILTFSASYFIDSWPCADPTNYETHRITNNVLSVRTSLVHRLMDSNRKIEYYAKFFRDSNSAATYYNTGDFSLSTLDSFSLPIEGDSRGMYKIPATNFYSERRPDSSYVSSSVDSMDTLKILAYDKKGKNETSYHNSQITIKQLSFSLTKAKAYLVEIENTLNIEEVKTSLYLGVNLKLSATVSGLTAGKQVTVRTYLSPATYAHDKTTRFNSFYLEQTATDLIYQSNTFTSDETKTYEFNNIPEDYYLDDTEASSWNENIFKMPFYHRNNDALKSNKFGFILAFIGSSDETSKDTTLAIGLDVFECKVFAKQEDALSGEIYSYLSGRIFNDTWTNRKTAANLIEAPTDIIEHVKRLERNDTDDIDFGHEYSPSVSIDTDTFDSTELVDIQNVKAGRQITDEGDQWTGKITESLCKEFFLCNYQNNLGQECVSNILRNDTAPTVAITFADIIPDSLSSVEELGASDIYCEPFVSYAFNPAYDKYDKQIKITNTHKATFDATYVVGLAGGESERLWNLARALYLKYGTVTQPPEDKTNLLWVYREADAVNLLSNWLTYMGAWQDEADGLYKAASRKRLSFSVSYDIAMTIGAVRKPWYVSLKVSISFPYHTSSETVYCIIENIEFDLEVGLANVTILTYDVTDELQFYIKNTYGASDDGTDWKKSFSTKAEAPTNGNDIKNNT